VSNHFLAESHRRAEQRYQGEKQTQLGSFGLSAEFRVSHLIFDGAAQRLFFRGFPRPGV
jgi:hypothetical protein